MDPKTSAISIVITRMEANIMRIGNKPFRRVRYLCSFPNAKEWACIIPVQPLRKV